MVDTQTENAGAAWPPRKTQGSASPKNTCSTTPQALLMQNQPSNGPSAPVPSFAASVRGGSSKGPSYRDTQEDARPTGASRDLLQPSSAQERLERSRRQNRESSRKARQRRKTEEVALKDDIQSNQIFRVLVESSPDMMSLHSMDTRAPYMYASSAYQRVAGISPRDLQGKEFMCCVADEDRPTVQQHLIEVLFHHKGFSMASYRMKTAQGKLIEVETSFRTGNQCVLCLTRAKQTGAAHC